MKQLHRIQHPEIFQGKKSKSHYFEGWYYKIVSANLEERFAIIPGIALDKKNHTSHAFIQFFNGMTLEMHYFRFTTEDFQASPTELEIHIGKNFFSLNHVHLDIDQDGQKINADFELSSITLWPKPSFGWGIMGPFAYIPFMECRHGLVSMNHNLRGVMQVNGKSHDFSQGKGYIEKDFGSSFPSAYIWMQSNHFDTPASLMVSIARIPSFGLHFTGFIGAFWCNNQFFSFTTYSGAKLSKIQIEEKRVQFTLEDKHHRLVVDAKKGPGVLLPSPDQGNMSNRILESLQGEIMVELFELSKSNSPRSVFKSIGKCAGVEIMGTHETIHLPKIS